MNSKRGGKKENSGEIERKEKIENKSIHEKIREKRKKD